MKKAEKELQRLKDTRLKLDNFAQIMRKTSIEELEAETQKYNDTAIEVAKEISKITSTPLAQIQAGLDATASMYSSVIIYDSITTKNFRMSNPLSPPAPQERYGRLAFEENEVLKKSGHFQIEHDMQRNGLFYVYKVLCTVYTVYKMECTENGPYS